LPTFVPFTGGPKPDYHRSDPQVVDAYEHYPRNPFKSWTKERPGSGSNITAGNQIRQEYTEAMAAAK
jgi:hypothetical protein